MGWILAALLSLPLVSIHIPYPVQREPATMRLRVTVDPRPANRWLQVVAEADTFSRMSGYSLNGDQAPKTHYIEWRDLPAGDYTVSASVFTETGKLAGSDRQHFIVTGLSS